MWCIVRISPKHQPWPTKPQVVLPTSPGPGPLVFSVQHWTSLSFTLSPPCSQVPGVFAHTIPSSAQKAFPTLVPTQTSPSINSCSSFRSQIKYLFVREVLPAPWFYALLGPCSFLYCVVIWLIPVSTTRLYNICGQGLDLFLLSIVSDICHKACHIIGYQYKYDEHLHE